MLLCSSTVQIMFYYVSPFIRNSTFFYFFFFFLNNAQYFLSFIVPWGLFEYVKDELAVNLHTFAFLFEGSIGILMCNLRYGNVFIWI